MHFMHYLPMSQNQKIQIARSTQDMGRILSSYRQANGLSQSELARQLNLHQASVSRLENGETNRVLNLVFRILSLLDLEIEIRPRRVGRSQDIADMFR
jgi:transcriptional regulator with XRE-family HTH domain